jgi:hypothetical protein
MKRKQNMKQQYDLFKSKKNEIETKAQLFACNYLHITTILRNQTEAYVYFFQTSKTTLYMYLFGCNIKKPNLEIICHDYNQIPILIFDSLFRKNNPNALQNDSYIQTFMILFWPFLCTIAVNNDKTNHLAHSKFWYPIRHHMDLICSSCEASVDIEWIPNLNRKYNEVWNLWKSNIQEDMVIKYVQWEQRKDHFLFEWKQRKFLFEWIPFELMESIFELQ